MSRAGVLLLLLLGGAAQAQIIHPMGETPGDLGPTAPASKAPDVTPERPPSLAGRERFSRFSAGRGGALFAFSQIVDGLVVGGLLGAGLSGQSAAPLAIPQGAYLGALTGGVGLGVLGVVLQYFQPIGLVAAGATALGLAVGAMAGLGLAAWLQPAVGSPLLPGLLALVGSQVGALVPLALLWRVDDLDPADLALMGAGALNAFALAALFNVALHRPLVAPALLLAPAIGMAVTGLLAAVSQIPLTSVVRYGAIPLAIGLSLFYLGGAVFQAPQLAALVAMGGMVATVGVTALVSLATPDEAPPAARRLTVSPFLAVVPASPRSGGLVVGPGLAAVF